MALTTLAKVKTHLSIPDSTTTWDAFFNQVIGQVSTLIKNELKNNIEQQTVSGEIVRGTGTPFFKLRVRPVQSITSLYLDGSAAFGQASNAFASSTQLTAGVDFALVPDQPDGTSRCGLVQRINGAWPVEFRAERGLLASFAIGGPGNIKVTYVAGFATVPADLELAANILVAAEWRERKRPGLTSESYEDYSYSVQRPDQKIDLITGYLANYRGLAW